MVSVLPSALATSLNALSWLSYQLTTTPTSIMNDLGDFARGDAQSMQKIHDGFTALAEVAGTRAEDARMYSELVYGGYGQVKLVFLVHAASQIPWGLLSAFQFNKTLRTKYPAVHRWTGRILLGSLVPVIVTGVQLVMASRILPQAEKVPFAMLIGGYPAYNALKGYLALVSPPPGTTRGANVKVHQYHLTKTAIFLTTIPAIRYSFILTLALANRIPWLRDTTGVSRYTTTLGFSFWVNVVGAIVVAEIWGWAFARKVGWVGSKNGKGKGKEE